MKTLSITAFRNETTGRIRINPPLEGKNASIPTQAECHQDVQTMRWGTVELEGEEPFTEIEFPMHYIKENDRKSAVHHVAESIAELLRNNGAAVLLDASVTYAEDSIDYWA